MSDFLGHIVTRGLNQAPAVRPRLPSLFEPIHGAVAPGWMESPTTSPASAQPFAPPDPGLARSAAADPARPALTAPTTGTTGGLPGQGDVSPNQAPPLPSPLRPRWQRPATGPPEPARRSEHSALPPGLDADQPTARVREVTPGNPLPAGKQAAYAGPLLPPAAPPLSDLHADPSVSAGGNRRDPAPRPGTPPPHQHVFQAAGPPQPAQRTIHVTIGRVEVRAMLPQQMPARVESSATARQSLEDYLKQRNGGRS